MRELCIVLLAAVLAGCGARRRGEQSVRQTEAVERWHADSLGWEKLSSRLRNRNATVRMVQLAKPDSVGRQAVESVAEVFIEETECREDSVTRKVVRTGNERKDRRVEMEAPEKKGKVRWVVWLLVGGVIGGLVLWRRWRW